jgi:hypothetical protein
LPVIKAFDEQRASVVDGSGGFSFITEAIGLSNCGLKIVNYGPKRPAKSQKLSCPNYTCIWEACFFMSSAVIQIPDNNLLHFLLNEFLLRALGGLFSCEAREDIRFLTGDATATKRLQVDHESKGE